MRTPPPGDDWTAITDDELPVALAGEWVVRPHCGAFVVFAGTVRDHAEGRPGVVSLSYEAYVEQAEARLRALADEARRRCPDIGRLALLHRVGALAVGDVSVVVAVSTPHRAEAFEVARWCIDTLKSTLPVWKRETWADGADWATGARAIEEVTQ
ncbi:MAG TPA: molybdenum cofactor biosynthesis protein MoaE [Acidimicrobiales bacterium]|nr:molybdenum cofactor biosynthesis protein MoaE [Acidimicrobiales bacterium]